MDNNIKTCVLRDDQNEMIRLLNSGLDPNYKSGWPIRLAARHGSCSVVRTLIQYGANPHLLSESGASTLQLAVYSRVHWDTDRWAFLLSCCDSSQLADGGAVAIIFHNIPALLKILSTGRCNTNIPTTLTGKTLDNLAKGYKLHHLLNSAGLSATRNITPSSSPRIREQPIEGAMLSPRNPSRSLSPSVARFFHQTASQPTLIMTSPRSPATFTSSPTNRP